ncbi:MAG: hypothetical protein SGPRY_000869 [Prymnesium sp.]
MPRARLSRQWMAPSSAAALLLGCLRASEGLRLDLSGSLAWEAACSDGSIHRGTAPHQPALPETAGTRCALTFHVVVGEGGSLHVIERVAEASDSPPFLLTPPPPSPSPRYPPLPPDALPPAPAPLPPHHHSSPLRPRKFARFLSSAAPHFNQSERCSDAIAPFQQLTANAQHLGVSCAEIVPLSALLFASRVEAICQASVESWSASAASIHNLIRWDALWLAPLPASAAMAELCPATCASSGSPLIGCAPSPPATSPRSPASPPGTTAGPLTPPLHPGANGAVSSLEELRALLAPAGTGGSVREGVREALQPTRVEVLLGGRVFRLGGKPLVVSGHSNVSISGGALDAEGLSAVLRVRSNARLRLSDLTLTNGSAGAEGGGALSVVYASATLERCVIEGGRALVGGCFAVVEGELSLLSCHLHDAHSIAIGGALFVSGESSRVVLWGCQLLHVSSGKDGGSIGMFGGVVRFVGCNLRWCEAGQSGGVAYSASSQPLVLSLSDCVIADTRAEKIGGMILSKRQGAIIVLHGTFVSDSHSEVDGGFAAVAGSTLRLSEGCKLVRCSAQRFGGAFLQGSRLEGPSLVLIKLGCVVSHLSASVGGTSFIVAGTFICKCSTISNSTAQVLTAPSPLP